MKKNLIYTGILALAAGMALTLTSCDDDFEIPPYKIPEAVDGSVEIGDGTWQKPFFCWQARTGVTVDGKVSNWVTGYIVGYIDTSISNTSKGAVFFTEPTKASAASNILMSSEPFTDKTFEEKGLLGDDAAELYAEQYCISVQLPSGSACRNALNLSNNPGNLNAMVSVRGVTGQKYCGIYGIRTAGDYNWGDTGRYEPESYEAGTTYYCNFSISRDMNYYIENGWRNYMLKGGETGWTIRESGSRSYAYISMYYGTLTDGPYENWLVTPAFNLDEAEAKTLSFVTSCSGSSVGTVLEAYVMTTQNPKGCEPKKLDCNVAPIPTGGGSSSWTPSGEIDLSEYSGIVYIGFRYYAEAGGSTNNTEYMVTDVNLGNANPEDWKIDDPTLKATYRLTDELDTEGLYLMVVNDQIVCPLAESFSYGAMTLGDEVSGDEVQSLTTYGFTFTEIEPGKYTIQDAYGRYLFMQGTYDTFNVNRMLPEGGAGAYWSIENENGVFKMTNLDMNKVISFSSGRGDVRTVSASSYNPENGPRLYKRVEAESK